MDKEKKPQAEAEQVSFALAVSLAKRMLAGRWQGTTEDAADLMAKSLAEIGLPSRQADALREDFLRALILELLSQANTVYTFPYSEAQLINILLPIWLENLRELDRPLELLAAFKRHYAEYGEYPVPSAILDYLPHTAFVKSRGMEADEKPMDPEKRRKLHQEFKENCRIYKFQKLAENKG